MRNQRGVSLIEVLVAMLVLGIGVMGYAAVQLNAVKLTEDTYNRSQAMAIAQDTIERLRANVSQIDSYADDDNWDNVGAWSSCIDRNNPCEEVGMVDVDITQLHHMASNMLPNGSILVDRCTFVGQDSDGNDIDVQSDALCIVVAWNTTTTENCNPSNITNVGDAAADAHCVRLEFIP